MKIHFKDIGQKKFSKVVEIKEFPNFQNTIEFCAVEMQGYMPKNGHFELVPTDGMPELLANAYVVVYTDTRYATYSMGTVQVYH